MDSSLLFCFEKDPTSEDIPSALSITEVDLITELFFIFME